MVKPYARRSRDEPVDASVRPGATLGVVLVGLCVLAGVLVLGAMPSQQGMHAPPVHASITSVTVSSTTSVATTTTPTSSTTIPDDGALPQTDARPDDASPSITARATLLWDAIVADDPSRAYGAFFPEAAYVQIKDVADPAADWQNRLIGAFDADVHALHAQLGADATKATLVGLVIPPGQADWIEPGVEANSGSYWRIYGSSLRYRVDGQERDLAVTSLISWRGEWYVVHLGPIR